MRIKVSHTIDDLARDMARIPVKAGVDMVKVTRDSAREGNKLAQANARRTAGAHGKYYPGTFSAESISPFVWEYGPDQDLEQGGMEFEHGSRNQTPHFDLAKSADVIGPVFADRVSKLPERWFW